jgi:hypothetical protein
MRGRFKKRRGAMICSRRGDFLAALLKVPSLTPVLAVEQIRARIAAAVRADRDSR